ncbi:porin [Burkholderia pseudomultivorans]|uniref:porin n=1 Tax=Burkholderia pseudomultivorans TaxID=1207504 RepID=UPI000A5A09EF|nr:porin [Burkholderia pseudomultivorans]
MIKQISLVLALGSLAAIARAQSSVTLSGVLDGGVRYTDSKAGATWSTNNRGWYSSNRVIFTGSEDLGAGWAAFFRLETGFFLASGELDNTTNTLFNRASYIGVRGPYGTLIAGRQFTIAHDVAYDYDPFNLLYPTLIPVSGASAGFRVSNDVKYIANVGGLDFRAENSFGGMAGNFNAGAMRGVGAQYKWNWLKVGGAYEYRDIQQGTTAIYRPNNYYTFGAELTFGKLRLAGGYMNENQTQAVPISDVRTLNYWGGATYDLSPSVRLGAAYYITDLPNQSGKRSLGIGSVTYALSKRTLLYAEVDYTKYGGSYITNASLNAQKIPHQIGAAVGINHSF